LPLLLYCDLLFCHKPQQQIQKGSVRVFLRFDAINQIVFDDVEPRSVLISCRDDRRQVTALNSITSAVLRVWSWF
jgi:hypothetical protein